MFKEWGFLVGEIWFLLLLAALLGLFAGWLIWSRRSAGIASGDYEQLLEKNTALEADLKICKNSRNDLAKALDGCQSRNAELVAELDACLTAKAEAKPVTLVSSSLSDGDSGEASRPEALVEPRDGKADDLKQIKGVGVKLEKLCNQLGFYHFDQIAKWTKTEVAWVDDNLEGFKGRVTRDEWVRQAKILARGGTTAFSEKVDKGEVDY